MRCLLPEASRVWRLFLSGLAFVDACCTIHDQTKFIWEYRQIRANLHLFLARFSLYTGSLLLGCHSSRDPQKIPVVTDSSPYGRSRDYCSGRSSIRSGGSSGRRREMQGARGDAAARKARQVTTLKLIAEQDVLGSWRNHGDRDSLEHFHVVYGNRRSAYREGTRKEEQVNEAGCPKA